MKESHISIIWNLETPKELLENHILKLECGDKLVVTGLNHSFGETEEERGHSLVYMNLKVIIELISEKPKEYRHIINTQEGKYTIERLK